MSANINVAIVYVSLYNLLSTVSFSLVSEKFTCFESCEETGIGILQICVNLKKIVIICDEC